MRTYYLPLDYNDSYWDQSQWSNLNKMLINIIFRDTILKADPPDFFSLPVSKFAEV